LTYRQIFVATIADSRTLPFHTSSGLWLGIAMSIRWLGGWWVINSYCMWWDRLALSVSDWAVGVQVYGRKVEVL
jgi:hypothetical protein